MKAKINGFEIEGTPEEMAIFAKHITAGDYPALDWKERMDEMVKRLGEKGEQLFKEHPELLYKQSMWLTPTHPIEPIKPNGTKRKKR